MTAPLDCELRISVAATDNNYLSLIVPHLARSCGSAVQRRTLVLDTAPICGFYAEHRTIGSVDQLREICLDLKRQGWVDEVVDVPYAEQAVAEFNLRTFGRRLRETHNIRGAPTYGHGFLIDPARSRTFLHLDADMLVYQASGRSWIEEGLALLRQHPDLLCILPLSGPPHPEGLVHQNIEKPARDPRGLWLFRTFTTRIYLLNAAAYRQMLPMQPLFLSKLDWLRSWFTGRGRMLSFESAVSHHLRRQPGRYRADLADGAAWHVHPLDKGPRFLAMLPQLIAAVEHGEFPPGQAGHYDLRLDAWEAWFAAKTAVPATAVSSNPPGPHPASR
jgi:hypothetical protein